MSIVANIQAEPVRFIAAIMATFALVTVVLMTAGVAIPVAVGPAVEAALAAWLSFITRNKVTPEVRALQREDDAMVRAVQLIDENL